MSTETSVPRPRDASAAALVDMLMLEAPVGLALFGPDLRFRWVNAALARFAEPYCLRDNDRCARRRRRCAAR